MNPSTIQRSTEDGVVKDFLICDHRCPSPIWRLHCRANLFVTFARNKHYPSPSSEMFFLD